MCKVGLVVQLVQPAIMVDRDHVWDTYPRNLCVSLILPNLSISFWKAFTDLTVNVGNVE